MFEPTVPLWEPFIRGALTYVAVLVLLRLTGKRQVGQFTPFDLVLLLLVSEAVSNGLSGGDNSITSGVIAMATMLLLNLAVGWTTMRSMRFEHTLEGRPQFLIKKGRVDYKVLRQEMLSKNDLLAAIREQGCFRPSEVEYAVLETSGRISVRKRDAPGD